MSSYWHDHSPLGRTTRWRFVRGATLSATAAAAYVAVGCGDDDVPKSGGRPSAAAQPSAAAAQASPARPADFLSSLSDNTPDPIPEKDFKAGAKAVRRHVPELLHGGATAAGLPVQVQLLGGDPEKMARAALVCIEAGATAIDLNFGCPARCVNQHDGGAMLLQHPERLQNIVATVRAAVPAHIPVSAKLRLGWDDMRAMHVNAERAAAGGARCITIHARTKS